ncbi:MAG TPA: cache domain-containing protein [Bacteroidota bacterium]|nr:cache domain-containing protein [Bacteroidota bacterium]
MKQVLAVMLAALIAAGVGVAGEKRGTPAEAEALVKRAIAFVKANGKEKAFEEFSNPKGKFVEGDLYIFVYDMTGKCLAHGGNARMVGKDLMDLKDADGKLFVKERVDMATSAGKGWQNYKWNNPAVNKIENKTAYIEKFEDIIVGAGAYKP